MTCICKCNRALLPNNQRNTLLNGRTNLLGASGFDLVSWRPNVDGASEKWRHLGWSGASEKHSTCTGASGSLSTAAYDKECTRPRTESISYKTTGCSEVLVAYLIGVTTSLTMALFFWVTIFFDRLTLIDAFFWLPMDYSECTPFTLNQFFLLLCCVTSTNTLILFFLNSLNRIYF